MAARLESQAQARYDAVATSLHGSLQSFDVRGSGALEGLTLGSDARYNAQSCFTRCMRQQEPRYRMFRFSMDDEIVKSLEIRQVSDHRLVRRKKVEGQLIKRARIEEGRAVEINARRWIRCKL